MIKKLKIKFIFLAMITVITLISIILIGLNTINYNSIVNEADITLNYLSQHKGTFPNDKPGFDLPPNMSPETPYESRYFSVVLNSNSEIIKVDITKINSINESTAIEYSNMILVKDTNKGFINRFRFIKITELDFTRIIFLDCGKILDSYKMFLSTSIFMGIVGIIIVFIIIFIISGKIVKPIAESYEKQKRFITDAGHEIKTPLTIINANTDLLELDIGADNESIIDIKKQVLKLRNLTDDLIILSKMSELNNYIQKIDFPLSETILEVIDSFYLLSKSQNKHIISNITSLITLNGDYKSISKLISILLDNAIKYSPENSDINIELIKQSKDIIFNISNKTNLNINQSQIHNLFERFYRADTSRNSEIGGYGIGLSIAHAIVNAHNGKISANILNSNIFKITIIFNT